MTCPRPKNLNLFLRDHRVTKANNGSVRFATEPENPVVPRLHNGFVGAALAASSDLHHLMLGPDDVWLAIATTFGRYVNAHSEEMRSFFVDHADRRELAVVVGREDWVNVVHVLGKLLPEHARDWFVPNFPTTTPKGRLVGGAVLMAAMKDYYSFEVHIERGLPSMTFEESPEWVVAGWDEIYRRVERLDQWYAASPEGAPAHPIEEWRSRLLPVIRKMAEAHNGVVNHEFWGQICNCVGGGSSPLTISGWVNLFVYFSDGKKVVREQSTATSPYHASAAASAQYGFLDVADISSGCVEVPVEISDCRQEISTIVYAGAILSSYDPESNEISPSYDFAVIGKDTGPSQ